MRHTGTRRLETERLILRRFVTEDKFDVLNNWASDPLVQHEYGEPVYGDIDAVNSLLMRYIAGYENDDFYRWAIIEKASGMNIGQIAFCRVYSEIAAAEIEYCISRNFRGRGYAGEALEEVIRYALGAAGFSKLEAYHRAENIASGRVLAKSIMQRTGTVERFMRENKLPDGEACYCVTADMI